MRNILFKSEIEYSEIEEVRDINRELLSEY